MDGEEERFSRRAFLERLYLGACAAAAATPSANAGDTERSAADPVLAPADPVFAPADPVFAPADRASGAFAVTQPLDRVSRADLPARYANPNILMLMVDQLRVPQFWLTADQQCILDTAIAPHLAWLRKNSVQFTQMYVAATACTPSRSAILTGLYTPQTGMFETQLGNSEPDLNTDFPTFGNALQNAALFGLASNGAQPYAPASVRWYGKWHLSNFQPQSASNPDLVQSFGFNNFLPLTKWPDAYGSPNGLPNEGSNGFLHPSRVNPLRANVCDRQIQSAFTADWDSPPPGPWFAAVSFINPHDINFYPTYFPEPYGTRIPGGQGEQNPPGSGAFVPNTNNADYSEYWGTCAGEPTTLFTRDGGPNPLPSTFNYELPAALSANKPSLQTLFLNIETQAYGNRAGNIGPTPLPRAGFVDFLNWYFYEIGLVDAQIDLVLQKVLGANYASGSGNPSGNTAVVFLSDHGDYGGSHGLTGKAGAVYDEALRVPFYVMLPGQTGGAVIRNQLCSTVDLFRFVLELAIGQEQTGAWWQQPGCPYPDQGNRQSLLHFLYNNSAETRTIPSGPLAGTPYILTTTDELMVTPKNCSLPNHVICIRTKSLGDANALPSRFYSGLKYAMYSHWVLNHAPQVDPGAAQQFEFYDYAAQSSRSEEVNNYTFSPEAGSNQANLAAALGAPPSQSSAATGLIGSELNAPLTGNGLASATAGGLAAFDAFATAYLRSIGCAG